MLIKQLWWGWLDLNQRPTGYEPAALTTELHPHRSFAIIANFAVVGYTKENMQNINTTKLRRLYRHLLHRYGTLNNAVIAVAFLIAASWAWSSVGVMEKNYRLQQELDLDSQRLELVKLQVENLRYEQKYYQTNEYKELSVRQHLGLASPGEKVLILPANSAAAIEYGTAAPQKTSPAPKKSNFAQWMEFLRGSSSHT